MPIRRSPNGARHVRPQPGRNRPEWVVAINRNARSQSVGTGGRNHSVRSGMEGIQLPAALALLLRADLAGARERGFERGLDVLPAVERESDADSQPTPYFVNRAFSVTGGDSISDPWTS